MNWSLGIGHGPAAIGTRMLSRHRMPSACSATNLSSRASHSRRQLTASRGVDGHGAVQRAAPPVREAKPAIGVQHVCQHGSGALLEGDLYRCGSCNPGSAVHVRLQR